MRKWQKVQTACEHVSWMKARCDELEVCFSFSPHWRRHSSTRCTVTSWSRVTTTPWTPFDPNVWSSGGCVTTSATKPRRRRMCWPNHCRYTQASIRWGQDTAGLNCTLHHCHHQHPSPPLSDSFPVRGKLLHERWLLLKINFSPSIY